MKRGSFLEASIDKAIQRERERIVELLEELEAVGRNLVTGNYIETKELITLIKGDK